jgi:hypothetical protein
VSASTLRRIAVAACLLLSLAATSGCDASPKPDPRPAVTAAPAATAAFEAQVKEYLALHRKLEAQLPKLSKETTPEVIDKNQRALAALVQGARPNATQGDFFTPEMQAYLRDVFDQVFVGTDGKNVLGSIMDENPGVPAQLVVNERYPDNVPLSTMPPEVLKVLPKLEEDMEYRFVGRRLVLLDSHAHLILDFTDELLPKSS